MNQSSHRGEATSLGPSDFDLSHRKARRTFTRERLGVQQLDDQSSPLLVALLLDANRFRRLFYPASGHLDL